LNIGGWRNKTGTIHTRLQVNFGFLFLGLNMALGHKLVQQHQNRTQCITWLKGSASLSSLLGLTWVFGFMFVNNGEQGIFLSRSFPIL
jgi:hypothetical protein